MGATPVSEMPADSELSIPVWIKYLRRTMMEESHSSPNVIHIFQTIVRHADLLYCARAHFATHVRRAPLRLAWLPASQSHAGYAGTPLASNVSVFMPTVSLIHRAICRYPLKTSTLLGLKAFNKPFFRMCACCASVLQMVNQLQRLGLPQTSSLEQKRLALDLAGLVIAWEKRRRSSASSGAKPAVRCSCIDQRRPSPM